MTNDKKLATFERIRQIVEEQIKLENHYATERRGDEAIDFIRLNAYVQIANTVIGPGTMK